MKTSILQRHLHKGRAASRFIDRVRDSYTLKQLTRTQQARSYYDSFDWRLYRGGRVLERDGADNGLCRIAPAAAGGPVLEGAMQGVPVFLQDFPPGPLREALTPLLGVRALLKILTVQVDIRSYELRDARDKILLRLDREHYRIENNGPALVNIRLYPLRGYEKAAQRVLKLLDQEDPLPEPRDGLLPILLQKCGRSALDYSSKLNLTLGPELTMGQALVQLLLYLLNILERNIDGIVADTDTEFLHDFRIAGRRSRSLITQVKNVFPGFHELPYKQAFSRLSVKTCEHRDLDVFLQDMRQHTELLPEPLRQDIEPLYSYLRQVRARQREALLQWLDSREFRDFRQQWRAYLEHSVSEGQFEENGKLPVLAVADHFIWKIYRRLIKQGSAVQGAQDFDALHEVRKTAKKLRYLLESFRSLYPRDQIEEVIQQLKRLQNLLGSIVDYHVQQAYLAGWSQSGAASGLPAATDRAAESLIVSFRALEDESCRKFRDRFTGFSSRANTAMFRSLFRRGK